MKDNQGEYALKLERVLKKRPRHPAEHEANVMRMLTPAPGIPTVIDFGYDRKASSEAMVLDLLGNDFQSLRGKGGDRFTIKTVLTLATLVVRLQFWSFSHYLHSSLRLLDPCDPIYSLERLRP